VAAPPKVLSLREIQELEAQQAAVAAAAKPALTPSELSAALKDMLGLQSTTDAPVSTTVEGSVWAGVPAVAAKKSLREIQEEEAAREAEAAARAAALAGSKAAVVAASPWAKAAAKGAAKVDAPPPKPAAPVVVKKSLRDIQVLWSHALSCLPLPFTHVAVSIPRGPHLTVQVPLSNCPTRCR
jgi:hypothetical protein